MMPAGSIGDTLYRIVAVAAIAFLGFLTGTYVMHSQAFPARYLSDAYRGGQALLSQETDYLDPFMTDLWAAQRTEARGTTVHDPERAYEGLTLYTSGHAQKAFLVSMDGKVVHEWHRPFSEVIDDTAKQKNPRPDEYMYFRKAHLYPNGDLLAIYIGVGTTPWGHGLVKLDKDSNVLWKYLEQVHHDIDVGRDGRIYTLTHEIRTDEVDQWAHLKPPRVDDFVAVLSPDGEELKKVDILKALLKSPYARLVNTLPWYMMSVGDYMHTNAIDVIEEAEARVLPFAEPGQVLISMREIGVIAILDLDREEVVWAQRGPWIGQHDPDVLPNGNMLLFDNYGNFGPGGVSRVIEFDPKTLEIVWSYSGTAERRFESILRSAQERLPNGNTLITESDGGRLLEVTREGEIVWEYVNPERGGEGGDRIPIVSWGQRIDPATLDPDFLGSSSTTN